MNHLPANQVTEQSTGLKDGLKELLSNTIIHLIETFIKKGLNQVQRQSVKQLVEDNLSLFVYGGGAALTLFVVALLAVYSTQLLGVGGALLPLFVLYKLPTILKEFAKWVENIRESIENVRSSFAIDD